MKHDLNPAGIVGARRKEGVTAGTTTQNTEEKAQLVVHYQHVKDFAKLARGPSPPYLWASMNPYKGKD